MSTSGGSNLEVVGPGEAVTTTATVLVGGRAVVSTATTTTPAAAAAVINQNSPYIRLSSLAVPVNQQQSQNHSIYQKVVDPNTVVLSTTSSNNKSIQKTSPTDETFLSTAATSGNNKPIIKDTTATYEFQDNEPYVVTVRNSPARSFSKSVSGTSIQSTGPQSTTTAPATGGLKVFSGAGKAGPRLALYRSNSSLDLLDRDNYLNNQARAFHNLHLQHSHAHQLSPAHHHPHQQQRGCLVNSTSATTTTAAQNLHNNQVHGGVGGVSPTTGCFTRRKDFGSHGSIDVLAAGQNAGFISSAVGGGHAVRSGSVGGIGTGRPFLSLMNTSGVPGTGAPDGIVTGQQQPRNSKVDQVDGLGCLSGSSGNNSVGNSGILDESKSLPASATKVSGGGVSSTRETASPRLRLKFHKLFEHGSSSNSSNNKDKNSSSNGNDKGMGNTVPSSTTLSATTTSSTKTEASIFRKFRSVSSTSRQQASKSLPEASKYDTTSSSTSITITGNDDGLSTTKVVLRHPGANPMEERYRRRALAHYDCQSVSANISYAARLRGLLSKRRNTTTGASAASLGQRSPPDSNNGGTGSTINGSVSPSSTGGGLSLNPQQSSHNLNPSGGSSSNISSGGSTNSLLQVPGQQQHPHHQDTDLGDGKSNALVLSCPYFRNEVGGEQERIVSLTRFNRTAAVLRTAKPSTEMVTGYRKVGIYGKATEDLDVLGKGPLISPSDEATHRSASCRNLALLEYRNGRTHWTQGICPYASNTTTNSTSIHHTTSLRQNMLEAVDVGANYYRDYFYKQDHENWFGLDENLGPLAISIRKERIDNQLYSTLNHYEGKSSNASLPSNSKYLYRLIVRSTELNTIRGSILEESIPGIKPNSSKGGVHAKDVIEFLLPEIQLSCLKLGTQTPQTEDQLLKLDEQVLTSRHKVGIMYCKAGQSTEEEMYNNESAGPAFNEFLDLIGQRIRLKGFDKYTGGLDNKDDSTGLHSIYSQYEGCEVIFHVSTLLPFTPNNRQQLMRKRHIGNDIVTIVFQEPGALPFTPRNIRSQFQHVFIVVRAINPCTDSTSYSVSVSRSREVPLFGPQIPAGAKFPRNQDFVEFLMAKVINAENATYRSEKFTTMATRTRQEYLKDLVANFTTSTTIDPQRKFSIKAFGGGKKKDFSKPLRFIGDATLQGALSWSVFLEDSFKNGRMDTFFGVSCDSIVIIDAITREAIFAVSTASVLGWNRSTVNCLRIYYHQGECITIHGKDSSTLGEGDLSEIVIRLEAVSSGCETQEFTLGRNDAGQLGFHVQQDGVVTEIESSGSASMVGLKQGSRLVEICKVAVATLTQDQMIDLLKNSNPVRILVIPPSLSCTARRGCDSKHCLFTLEPDQSDYENVHLKNGVREDGDASYSSKSPHPHFKSNALNSHQHHQRKRYEPRSFSPPRSSNSSGYGTGSSSKSFSSGNGDTSLHHISPHHEGDASASCSSGGLSGEDKWYDLNDNLKEGQYNGTNDARCTPPPVPARAPTSNNATPIGVMHNNNNNCSTNKNNNLNGTPQHHHSQFIDTSGFPGYRGGGDSLKHSASMNNGASPAVASLLDRSFLIKKDYFQRSSPHHGSFHTKLSPSRSHDMLHLKNLYGLNQLRTFPGSSVGLDQTPTGMMNGGGVGVGGGVMSRSAAYLTPQGRLVREKTTLGVTTTPMSNGYHGMAVPENTIRGKMTYLTDFPLTHSCSSEQIQSLGMQRDDLSALKNERLAAIKQAYQEKHKDRDRRFKKEASPSFNGNERRDTRDSSSPDDDLIVKHNTRPGTLNVSRPLTNGNNPKGCGNLSTEVKLRNNNNNQAARNAANRSSTLQEDLIRLISPEYISGGSGSSDNGIDTAEETSPDSEPSSASASLHQSLPPSALGLVGRPGNNNVGADPPSSELYSMRLSAIGSASPKYINPQRQSWSTTDSGDERKSYVPSTGGSINGMMDGAETPNSSTGGFRSKSPLKHSYSANLYSEPRTPVGPGGQGGVPNSNFRVTPAVSVGHWMKDELKTPSSEDGDRSSVSPIVPIESVFNLEARVSQLEAELRMEQQSKRILAAKVENLQEENRRLQEESHSTQDQFIKFKEWLLHTVEGPENQEEDC